MINNTNANVEDFKGWKCFLNPTFNLIQKLENDLSLNVFISKFEEKLGVLNIEISLQSNGKVGYNKKIYDLISNACLVSSKICVECGMPGCLRNKDGKVKTLCSNCYLGKETYCQKDFSIGFIELLSIFAKKSEMENYLADAIEVNRDAGERNCDFYKIKKDILNLIMTIEKKEDSSMLNEILFYLNKKEDVELIFKKINLSKKILIDLIDNTENIIVDSFVIKSNSDLNSFYKMNLEITELNDLLLKGKIKRIEI